MVIRLTVISDTSVFVQLAQDIQDAPERLNAEVQKTVIPKSQARTDATINQPLREHQRPTDWQTPKQRRWWYAVGITHWRGRKAKQDWKVRGVFTATGGQLVAENDQALVPYVFGERQQRMHMGVWVTTYSYVQTEGAAAAEGVVEAWNRVFVRKAS